MRIANKLFLASSFVVRRCTDSFSLPATIFEVCVVIYEQVWQLGGRCGSLNEGPRATKVQLGGSFGQRSGRPICRLPAILYRCVPSACRLEASRLPAARHTLARTSVTSNTLQSRSKSLGMLKIKGCHLCKQRSPAAIVTSGHVLDHIAQVRLQLWS